MVDQSSITTIEIKRHSLFESILDLIYQSMWKEGRRKKEEEEGEKEGMEKGEEKVDKLYHIV
tara:strand:- start:319 stop:504 length:186 start_codon:yes stop_codon:yes gene_type:complete